MLVFFYDDANLEIFDVLYIERKRSRCVTPKRPFHILTKRLSGFCEIAFSDVEFQPTTNNLLYIPPSTEYVRKSDVDEVIIAIHFNINNKSIYEPMLIDVDSKVCDEVFKKIYDIWAEKSIGYKYKCMALIYDYLSNVIVKKDVSRNYIKLEKSIRFIEKNICEKIYIGDLAKISGMCESYYRRLFKKELGISPVEYINKLRISMAKEKIISGYYNMSEISEMCGFSEQKYFNKIYKEETNLSPTEYKNFVMGY